MPRNITVTLADGTKHVYQNAPDNITPDQVSARAQKDFGQSVTALDGGKKPAPAPPAKPAPSFLSQAGTQFGMGVRGVLGGVAGLGDIVAAPLNTTINAVAGTHLSTRPFSQSSEALSDKMGLHSPSTSGEQWRDAINRGATGALVPVLGAEATAGRMAASMAPAARTAAVRAFAAKPATQVIAGATSGGSSELAKRSGAGWLGQMAAGMAGSLIAPGAISTTSDGLASVFSHINPAAAPERAAATLSEAATRPKVAASTIAARPAPSPGASPTLAEASRDPGLAAFQRARPSPLLAERHGVNAQARQAAVTDTMGNGDPQAVQETGAQVRQATEGAAAQARAKIGPVADRVETSDAARQAFEANHDAAKAKTNAAYNAPVLTAAHPVDIPKPVFDQINAHADDFYGDGGGLMPEKLRSIIDDVATANPTSRTFTNIDRRLADFSGESRMVGRNRDASFADSVRRTLDNHVTETMPQEYRDALTNAKQTRAEQGRVFETGAVPSAMARDQFGNPTTGPAELPTRLVRPGPAGGDTAAGLTEATSPATAEATTRQELRRIIDEKGAETGAQVHGLRMRYTEAINRFPGLANDFQAAQERAALNDAYKASPLGRIASPSVDPATEIAGLLTKKDGGRALAALAEQIKGNATATSGLHRAIGKYVEDASAGGSVDADGATIPDAGKARDAVRTVLDRAGGALTNPQKVVLNRVHDELSGANFAEGASRQGADAPTSDLSALAHAVPGGRTLKATIGVLLKSFTNAGEVQKLLNKAILDPDYAAELLNKATPNRVASARSKLAAATKGGALGAAVTANQTD